MKALFTPVELRFPGVLAAIVVAIAALFLSEHYGGPVMLFALLLGMALNFLGSEGRTVVGVQWAGSTLLRISVALLGLRITFADIAGLGIAVTALVVLAVVLTILFGRLVARLADQHAHFGVLTGGAVAICGASAALAIAAVLPRHAHAPRDASFTVIGVTALSTIAMVLYPPLARMIGFTEHEAGIFLGATIHDVAQVVGAGYSVSADAGDTATLVKLVRVAMLLPVILVLSILLRRRADTEHETATASRPPLLPWFAVAFATLVVLNSTVPLPSEAVSAMNTVSRFLLVTAIAAIGMKTQLRELVVLGPKPVLLIVSETLFIALLMVGAILMLR